MKIVHLSYAKPDEVHDSPGSWLERIGFITGIFEAETSFAEVHAFYHLNFRTTIVQNRVTYHFTGLNKLDLLIPLGFNKTICSLKPQVIIVHGLIFPVQLVMLARKNPDAKIFVQHHAERPFRQPRRFLQRLADTYVSAYFFTSRQQSQEWFDAGVIRSERKIREIMGTSSVFSGLEKRKPVDASKTFLWVGNLDANKDPLTLLEAFAMLLHQRKDVRLLMVFQAEFLIDKVKNLIAEKKISDFVELAGRCTKSQLAGLYQRSGFIVSTSHYEGSGISVCEAMSCGCIPIVTGIPSLKKITNDGRLGFLFPPGDSTALGDQLHRAMSIDVETQRELVLDWFEKELSFSANALKIKSAIYEHL